MICNNYAFSERRKRQSLEKKIHQIGSNIFEPVPSGLSLSLSHFPSNETPREGRVRGSDEGGEGGGGGG